MNRLLFGCLALMLWFVHHPAFAEAQIAIRAGWLLDVQTGKLLQDQVILIEKNRILERKLPSFRRLHAERLDQMVVRSLTQRHGGTERKSSF